MEEMNCSFNQRGVSEKQKPIRKTLGYHNNQALIAVESFSVYIDLIPTC
jgi:hypothetical protein